MHTGTVKWFDPDKGYGFITPDKDIAEGKDIFVHISAVKEAKLASLEKDDRITFEIGMNKGKSIATSLKKC